MFKFFMRAIQISVVMTVALSPFTAHAFENYLKVGIAQYTIEDKEPGGNATGKPIGAYVSWIGEFNDFLSVEARFGGSGNATDNGVKLNAGGVSAFFRPYYSVGEKIKLYGLIGASSIAIGRTVTGFAEETVARTGVSYGLGADVRLSDSFLVGAEWTNYLKNADVGAAGLNIKMSVSSLAASVTYQF